MKPAGAHSIFLMGYAKSIRAYHSLTRGGHPRRIIPFVMPTKAGIQVQFSY
jgi:hypothetical protein